MPELPLGGESRASRKRRGIAKIATRNPSLILPALVALSLGTGLPPAAADVLPPGSRGIEHTLVLEPSPWFERLELHAFPTAGFGGATRLAPGEPFTFSSKYGTRIYAFETGTAPEEWRLDLDAGNLRDPRLDAPWFATGEIPVREDDAVPIASPVESVRTTLRIASIEAGTIRLEVVGENVEWNAPIVAAAAAAAALGLAGLAFLIRARNAAPRA
jgi:hypothetical protein